MKVSHSFKFGENIRRQGSVARKGRQVLFKGQRPRTQEIGILELRGAMQVNIYQKALVVLHTSGDVLTSVDKPVQPW